MNAPVIDFRVRPPYKSFASLPLFRDREEWSTPAEVQTGLTSGRGPCESHRLKSMDLFLEELDDAGVTRAVVPGRRAAGKGEVPNEDVAELLQEHPDRFVGFGSIGSSEVQHADKLLEQFTSWGFRGISFEPPWFEPPLHFSDASFDDFYQACEESGMVLMLTSSIYVGPDLSYSDPVHIQRIAERHPKLPIVVSHAAWPHVMGLLGVAFRYPNVYVMPDLYGNIPELPGHRDWVDAANSYLAHRMLFASAYPIRSVGESVEAFTKWDISESSRDLILSGNSSRLLGLE